MSNLNFNINVALETTSEKNAMRRMLETIICMEEDMLTDELYISPADVRKMATQSDAEIRSVFSDQSKLIYNKFDYVLALHSIADKFDKAADER